MRPKRRALRERQAVNMSIRALMTKLLRSVAGPPPVPPPSLSDSTFGRIEYSNGQWFGSELRLAAVSPYPLYISVPGTVDGPSVEGRRRFSEIIEKLPELNAQVGQYLLEDYQGLREHPRVQRKALPVARSPDEIWGLANVVAIYLVPPPGERAADFELDYGMAWDDDHAYNAFFENWQLVEFRKDG
jgi:hypothetical protein